MSIRIFLRHDDVSLCTNLYLMIEEPNGDRAIAKPVTLEFQPIGENSLLPQPTIQFRNQNAISVLQGLADELALMGYTPNKTKETQGELAAVRYHLEDMRKIIFEHWRVLR